MNFELRHAFEHSPERVWETLFSPDYEQAAASLSDITKEVVEEREEGVRSFRRTLCTSPRELPAMMRRAIGSDRLTYTLEEIRHNDTMTLQWRVIPTALGKKVRAEGSYRVIPALNGCERLVKGEVTVAIPLVGGKIERAIGGELKAGYETAWVFARKWLQENP
jgi:hypothetical protein